MTVRQTNCKRRQVLNYLRFCLNRFSAKSQKRQSTIPVRPGGGKFPGRNLARPVAGNLIAEGSDEKEMSNNNSKSTSCFGFLRPTLSSMAKTKPHVQHDSIKSNESEHKSPAKVYTLFQSVAA